MDLNRLPISSSPVVLEVRFLFRLKSELRDIIIREKSEEFYLNFLRSSVPVVVPKVHDAKLCFFIYL